MKDIIITVGLILLGVLVFTLILGTTTGDGSMLGLTNDFFSNMAEKFNSTTGAGTVFP